MVMSSMSRERKKPSERGAGRIQRSKSGGAVKGKIPKAGGYNRTNHETGITVSKMGKDKPKKYKGEKAYLSKSIASKGMGNGKST